MFSAATKTGSQPSQAANYIEDVFSTYLYTGTGLSVNNTITNGIDLAAEGGLVWTKARSVGYNNALNDTARGFSNYLISNSTGAQNSAGSLVTMTANSNGYTVNDTNGSWNESGQNFVSWTFRKQPKFFDVVTYTGDGTAGRTVSHSLGSTPGMMIVKCTSASYSWFVYHRSVNGGTNPQNYYMLLNDTAAQDPASVVWNDTAPTSTEFTVGTAAGTNANGQTYVAYLFAHNAGGFGTSGTDNVISCGSFTSDGSGKATINLGYEPQYVLLKRTDDVGDWILMDVMRGMTAPPSSTQTFLNANNANAENSTSIYTAPTSTGMYFSGFANRTFIYMAIRRPMKVPTDATTVFNSVARTGTGANATVSSEFVTDTVIEGNRTSTTAGTKFGAWNRLRGTGYNLTTSTVAEVAAATTIIQANPWDVMDGYKVGTTSALTNQSGVAFINWMFKRATGFHDVVCYTGTGSATTVSHNLGVTPELMIFKQRSAIQAWIVYNKTITATDYLQLNTTGGTSALSTLFNNTEPTSSVFTVGTNGQVNGSGSTYVAYLFATCLGVSKVGSYTGNGSTQAISCGFTGGARFVLIKRTDSTGAWYVYDTARGMTTLTDPYLLLNSTAAESATLGSVTTTTGGFTVNASILAAINTSGASYIFLAIA